MAVDMRLEKRMKENLKKYIGEFIEIPPCTDIHPSISGHPDMQMIHIKENLLVCQPLMPDEILLRLRKYGFIIYKGLSELRAEYPCDIAYNAAIIGDKAFHNTKYTDPVLAGNLKKFSIRLVHVNQGYARCSVLPVTPESIITADPSIARVASEEGIDVLEIPPQKRIKLDGLDYGFIGGAAGFIDETTIAFTGSIDFLDNKDDVEMFLKKYGVDWVCLDDTKLCDYGGLLPLYE